MLSCYNGIVVKFHFEREDIVMKEFVNMFKNYANFTSRTTRRGFWMAVLFLFTAGVIVSFVEGLLGLGSITELAPNVYLTISGPIGIIFGLAILVPGIAIEVRRLRDAGLPWQNLFYVFIPIAGMIILIVKFCKPSIPENEVPVV